ncbi:conserved Plasmodium protein, unknown function [Plasmodium gallinaceum]|uniref:Uncharacterized protein n=1 Tax=Plasmodium gallinaceum TaxID=5849 RepID=A0A1J1GXK4_PLAGA|nr:conserved Plasmodium protein, unknown function [Plasmodium gallinaceum]CRG97188.1 conserved Plasmodium protein, unknown function [Plasmodium gallinaceum]
MSNLTFSEEKYIKLINLAKKLEECQKDLLQYQKVEIINKCNNTNLPYDINSSKFKIKNVNKKHKIKNSILRKNTDKRTQTGASTFLQHKEFPKSNKLKADVTSRKINDNKNLCILKNKNIGVYNENQKKKNYITKFIKSESLDRNKGEKINLKESSFTNFCRKEVSEKKHLINHFDEKKKKKNIFVKKDKNILSSFKNTLNNFKKTNKVVNPNIKHSDKKTKKKKTLREKKNTNEKENKFFYNRKCKDNTNVNNLKLKINNHFGNIHKVRSSLTSKLPTHYYSEKTKYPHKHSLSCMNYGRNISLCTKDISKNHNIKLMKKYKNNTKTHNMYNNKLFLKKCKLDVKRKSTYNSNMKNDLSKYISYTNNCKNSNFKEKKSLLNKMNLLSKILNPSRNNISLSKRTSHFITNKNGNNYSEKHNTKKILTQKHSMKEKNDKNCTNINAKACKELLKYLNRSSFIIFTKNHKKKSLKSKILKNKILNK